VTQRVCRQWQQSRILLALCIPSANVAKRKLQTATIEHNIVLGHTQNENTIGSFGRLVFLEVAGKVSVTAEC